MEESRRLEDPLSMIKIERNVWRRMVLAKHIFGYDLENYCERRFLRFNLSPQVWRANPIQCNPIFSQRLSGLDFSVESQISLLRVNGKSLVGFVTVTPPRPRVAWTVASTLSMIAIPP